MSGRFFSLLSLPKVLSKGVAAVLGPRSLRNSDHIKSICDNSEIPFIETRGPGRAGHLLNLGLDDGIKVSGLSGPGPASSLSLHPDPAALGQALVDIVRRSHLF